VPFFDFLNDDAAIRPQPQGSLPVSMSGQGSIVPQSVDTKKRGKKTRVAAHRIKPLTPLDKAKLETLQRTGGNDPSIEELEQFGIRYEIDPNEATQGRGMGNPQEAMLQTPRDPKAYPQGNLSDLTRPAAAALDLMNPVTAVQHTPMGMVAQDFSDKAMEQERGRADTAKTEAEAYKIRAEVQKMQQESALAEEPEPVDPAVASEQKKETDENARALLHKRAVSGEDGTPGRDSIFEVFGTLYPDHKRTLAKQAAEVMKIVGERVPFNHPMQHLAFWMAVPAFADALGDEAKLRVLGPTAMLEKKWRNAIEGRQQSAGESTEAGNAGISELKRLLEQQKKLQEELNNINEINSPLGVIAYVLMSLAIGPHMAAFILTRSSRRGKLPAELNEISQLIDVEAATTARHFKMADAAGRAALEGEDRLMGQQADRAERQQSRFMEHQYRMHEMKAEYEARKRLQGGKDDPAAKALIQSFNNQKNILASAEKRVDRLREEVKQWSTQASSTVDGTMREDFVKRWRGEYAKDSAGKPTSKLLKPGAEQMLIEAEQEMALAEEALMKIAAIWNRKYGNAPIEKQPSAEAGGE
jgi:hypothetical protein